MGRHTFLAPLTVISFVFATLLGASGVRAEDPVARFTAFAVNLGGPGPAAAGVVDISVNRWSTDGERDRLIQILQSKGPERLLDVLSDMRSVGRIRTPDSIGYDLRFAHRQPGEDGGEQITIITDRYVSYWEAYYRPRTIDYPFTVIDLQLNRDGEGEGKMSLATRITAKGNRVVLENYSAQPVLLNKVRRTEP